MYNRRRELNTAEVVSKHFLDEDGKPTNQPLVSVLQIDQILGHFQSDNEVINQ